MCDDQSASLEALSVRVNCNSSHFKQQIKNFLPQEFFLQSLSFDCDFNYQGQDLASLTGLVSQTSVTQSQVLKACFYLKQIDRFKSIELKMAQLDNGYELTFYLSGHMLLSSLQISGYLRGKEWYKNAYLLDIGEPFDEQKHQHSLQDIQKMFFDTGYCKAQIVDHVEKNVERKTVAVALALSKNKKFSIDAVAIEVEGLGHIVPSDLERMRQKLQELATKKLRHKFFSQELVKKFEQKAKELLERYGFMNFEITTQPDVHATLPIITLHCKVVLDQKKEFVFFGNHFFKKQELLHHLLMYGKSSWHFPCSIIIDELEQLYKSRGFWDVKISVKEEKHRLFCVIQENKRAIVSSVRFKDNESFSYYQLLRYSYKPCLKARFYHKDLLKKSHDQLIRLYKQHGFWDAKIAKQEFVPLTKKNNYQLVLTLDEGKQRMIGTCRVDGHEELLSMGPFAKVNKQHKKLFDPSLLVEQKQWLARYFKNKGYSKVGLDYKVQEVSKDTLDIIWHVSLQDQAVTFGKVLVTGNSVIPPTLILKERAFEYGDPWDKSKLEETLKRLRELDVFESVQLYPSREIDDDCCKPIFVKTVDADRYELRTRMGVQQVGKNLQFRRGFTYKFGADFFIRNPFHFGDLLVLKGNFTKFYRDSSLSYQFPWLRGHRVRSLYKAYDSLYCQPVYIGSKNSLYQSTQRGFLLNMTKCWSELTVSGTGGIEFMGIKEADQPDLHTIIDYDKELLGKKTGYLFVEPNLMWQHTDNLLNPKRGHLSLLTCKAMIDLNTKTSFLKILFEHSCYISLIDSFVLATRVRLGHVFNKSFDQLIPIERFYLGGPGSLRGYERDYCPPLGKLTEPIHDIHAGLPPEACDLWRYAPQGGRTMANINCELRFALYQNLGGVIFNDIGLLFKDKIEDIRGDGKNKLLGGSGFGFRYDTPIGPLRFDIGIKWRKMIKNFEARWTYYLTLGHAF